MIAMTTHDATYTERHTVVVVEVIVIVVVMVVVEVVVLMIMVMITLVMRIFYSRPLQTMTMSI